MRLGRRKFLLFVAGGAPAALRAYGAGNSTALRGKLRKDAKGQPALQTTDGRVVPLKGDEETTLVLSDTRLEGADFEALGKPGADGAFAIEPIHQAALWAWKDGKRKRITYWCDVCAIRTYSPGLCWCCREETALDLRDPDTVESK